MKILVTGSAGFIGSHLCKELAAHGHEIIEADREQGDLRVANTIHGLLTKDEHPDIVVHLAAKVGRLFGEDDVVETVVDNAGMTALIAQACGQLGVPLVYASTSEVYGDGGFAFEWNERQAFIRDPHNLYGLSKRWGEEACNLYAPEGLILLRLSMPYGTGHPPGRGRAAITNFLHQALNKQPIPVHRGAERSWCWVGDTVRAVRLILESGEIGAWNVGRDDDPRKMLEVAKLACDLTGASHDLIREIDPPARQTVVKRLSTRRLMQLGWKPEVELEEGMERILDWIRGGCDPKLVTLERRPEVLRGGWTQFV